MNIKELAGLFLPGRSEGELVPCFSPSLCWWPEIPDFSWPEEPSFYVCFHLHMVFSHTSHVL